MVDATLHTVRRVISNLRPAVLDELGLKPAIEWQAQEFSRRAGIRCAVQAEVVENVDKEVEIAVFRIFQELLTNVLRHARASRVNVEFSGVPPNLNLAVRDNGRGFSLAEAAGKKSFGLLGMRERVSALGGRFEITSKPGEGTAVAVSLPLNVKAP
jgi:two-component system, NarL family, sensor histidine kinase UhpB